MAICERDGSLWLTTSRRPGATAHWSGFWGVLLEAVMNGDCGDECLGEDFPARLRLALIVTEIFLFVIWIWILIAIISDLPDRPRQRDA